MTSAQLFAKATGIDETLARSLFGNVGNEPLFGKSIGGTICHPSDIDIVLHPSVSIKYLGGHSYLVVLTSDTTRKRTSWQRLFRRPAATDPDPELAVYVYDLTPEDAVAAIRPTAVQIGHLFGLRLALNREKVQGLAAAAGMRKS